MQYFEGTEPATQETWDRIRASKRHSGLVELFDAAVDHRLFGAWEMGFARPTTSEMLELSNLKWKSMRSTSGAIYPRPDALVLLEQFWKLSQK